MSADPSFVEGDSPQPVAASHPHEAASSLAVTTGTGVAIEALGDRFSGLVQALERPLVFFDIEATGTDPVFDRIVEISLLRVGPPPMGLEAMRTWRVDPQMRIPSEASEIHGILNTDVAGFPTFKDIADEIESLVNGSDLAGFSIGRFDIRILQAEFVRAGRTLDLSQTKVVDTQVIYHQREPRNLTAALKFYRDRDLEGAHGAAADTIATLEVLAGQLERYGDLELNVEALHQLSSVHNDAYCDTGRRFSWRDGEPVFNFGRLRGKSLRFVAGDPVERKYLKWFLDGTFDEDAKAIVRDALQGRILQRVSAR